MIILVSGFTENTIVFLQETYYYKIRNENGMSYRC